MKCFLNYLWITYFIPFPKADHIPNSKLIKSFPNDFIG